jgi:hypothetical protein
MNEILGSLVYSPFPPFIYLSIYYASCSMKIMLWSLIDNNLNTSMFCNNVHKTALRQSVWKSHVMLAHTLCTNLGGKEENNIITFWKEIYTNIKWYLSFSMADREGLVSFSAALRFSWVTTGPLVTFCGFCKKLNTLMNLHLSRAQKILRPERM